MRGRGLISAFAGALAIAAIGVGCGSDSDGSQVKASVEVTKPDFLKKAEAVCTKNYENVRDGYTAFVRKNGGPENAFDDVESQIEFVDTVLVPEKKKTVEEFRELVAPEEDEQKVEELLDAYEEGIEVAEEDPEVAMSSQGVFAYASNLAKEYGLDSCRS